MFASASSHAPNRRAVQLAVPQLANNDGESRPDVGLRAHEQDDEKQPTQSPAHVSPAMRLYRHALESIFAMLNLHDLTQILAVNRWWSAAVRSMKPIGATIERDESQLKPAKKLFRPLPPVPSLVASPLLRHLAAIHIADKYRRATPLNSESLAMLSQHAPNLVSLWCDLTLTPSPGPLPLPQQLTALRLRLSGDPSAAEFNSVLMALGALPSLSCLRLEALTAGADVSLLAASRTLTDLRLDNANVNSELSDAQVAQVRSSLGHLQRINVACMDPDNLPRFLQPPHTARWQDIGPVFADARTGDLLATLPTLTKLALIYRVEAPHANFLSKLPLLSDLTLNCARLISPASLLASLLPCTGLAELALDCGFNSAHVGPLLAVLAKLRKLTLTGELETLQCFASGPVTRTLEALHLNQLDRVLPPSEIVHLYALQGLRRLELYSVFKSLDDAAMRSLTPPTVRLPRLTWFVQKNARDWAPPVERTGPSFENLQQPLPQDDENRSPQASTLVSPAMRIYRHALESILSMLELADLSCVLAVSRSWSAAVRSMKPIGATIERREWSLKKQGKASRSLPTIVTITGPLLRHLTGIHVTSAKSGRATATPFTSESMTLLSQQAPHLTSLWCDLAPTPGAALILPANLQSLVLMVAAKHSPVEINGVLARLAALSSLSCLVLRVLPADGVDLSLLAASSSLTDFTLQRCDGRCLPLSDAQVARIRSSLGHLARFNITFLDRSDVSRLLQPPHTARWQDIGEVHACAETGDLQILAALPTLTKLDLTFHSEAAHADFLTKLPLLSSLKLNCNDLIPAASMLSSLLQCTGLTELEVYCGFNSAQVSSLLAALTKLRTFSLQGDLDSLQCFASGPATRTLEVLDLTQWLRPLHPSELVHLYALEGLRSLELCGVLASLDDAGLQSLTPPTSRLPRLTQFAFTGKDYKRVSHAGPSFEQTQQRLAQ